MWKTIDLAKNRRYHSSHYSRGYTVKKRKLSEVSPSKENYHRSGKQPASMLANPKLFYSSDELANSFICRVSNRSLLKFGRHSLSLPLPLSLSHARCGNSTIRNVCNIGNGSEKKRLIDLMKLFPAVEAPSGWIFPTIYALFVVKHPSSLNIDIVQMKFHQRVVRGSRDNTPLSRNAEIFETKEFPSFQRELGVSFEQLSLSAPLSFLFVRSQSFLLQRVT